MLLSADRPASELSPRQAPLFNIGRLRKDLWTFVRDHARRLRRLHRSGAVEDEHRRSCAEALEYLSSLEAYHAFPGPRAFLELTRLFERGAWDAFARQTVRTVRLLATGGYRRLDLAGSPLRDYADLLNVASLSAEVHDQALREARPYFEVLVVDELTDHQAADYRARMMRERQAADPFVYDMVPTGTFEDALMASLANYDLQAVVIRYSFPFKSKVRHGFLNDAYTLLDEDPARVEALWASARSLELGRMIKALRPELDLYLVTDAPVEHVVGEDSQHFRRVFYHEESHHDVHLSLLKGVQERFETPFFAALRRYSQKPTGVFHALPISRGNSIAKSHWIKEFGRFYGNNMFQAETSATTGGLDSLLQPHGSLKQAQAVAARAFGARNTYFVTNGTSTANKIVLQALIRPGDIVMLAHDCHKSHHYAVILAGARPVYLDAYALTEYSMYGGVRLEDIKRHLLELKAAGKLERVKLLLLTNMTFDGVTYDPFRIMEEVLAIKPDMVFVWDEAWFGFARFAPALRRRTAMDAARRLHARYASPAYREEYARWKETADAAGGVDGLGLDQRLLPDPDAVRIRAYATHSTHKTLTALRQGSMIHVHDQDFEHGVRSVFNEAYMTHTSTSPNYQILASLDMGRRQVELEGYELVLKSVELAMTLRERVRSDRLLQKYFRVLGPGDMVPSTLRPSGIEAYFDPARGWSRMEDAWTSDEFVLDPTRITLDIGRTGLDGDTFKALLMDRFDIQINKTSRNSVLFMVHIGMTRGTVSNLVKVLTTIARELDDRQAHRSDAERTQFERKVRSLTVDLPPLPNFSRFHPAFRPGADSTTPEGDMRDAFFLAYDDAACGHVRLDRALLDAVRQGREVVSASFVTPYPPGFPVLMPGQVMTADILNYLLELDVKEIHGYEPAFGLRIFKPAALAALVEDSAEVRRAAASDREGVQA